ncbi:hypothetical protein JCM10908_005410 [Rhodotorula pacifica]|uniref:uncharacterized protein n=1 Tax=Rhodotorula pacifica TaxID=1495444 RepID=UPI00316D9295
MPSRTRPGLGTHPCVAYAQLVKFSRTSWGCLPALPANTTAGLVLLKRPITFVVACIAAIVAVLASWILNLTGLEPPSCPAEGPRTRPRPSSPVLAESPHANVSTTRPQAALRSLTSFVSDTLRPKPAAIHPPVSQHPTGPRFRHHELDGVVEADESEDTYVRSRSRPRWSRTPSPESSRTSADMSAPPALTPDTFSDADTDDWSESEVLGSLPRRAGTVTPKEAKLRGLHIFTSGFKWRRSTSQDRQAAFSASPISIPSPSEKSAAEMTAPESQLPPQAVRHRATTIAHPRQPPTTSARPEQRRHVSDSATSASWSSAETSSSNSNPSVDASATSSGVSATTDASSSAGTANTKKAPCSLLLRSRSSRSVKNSSTSSDSLSPTSSHFGSATTSSLSSCLSLKRRGLSPARTSSLDSTSSRSSGESTREKSQSARGRKPVLSRRLPMPSPPLSQQVVDLGGQSGLSLGDFAP